VSSAPPVAGGAGDAPKRATTDYIHSDIFVRLVEDKDDLPGLVAYGLYQQRKRQWISFYEDQNGQLPDPRAREDYANGHRDDAIQALREEAEGSLARFADEVMSQQTERMEINALNGRMLEELDSLKKRVGKISGYRHHIVGHVFGFIVLVFITLAATVAITHEPTLREFVQWIFGKLS